MYAKKSRFRLWPFVMLLLLILGAGIGSIAAKYVYSQKLEARVTFTAKLADDLVLLERRASRTAEGDYTISTDPTDTVEGNTYMLMPGVDIPKDPYVQVVNKTPIRAYLYVEVVKNLNVAIEYQMAPAWIKLDDLAGKHGGTVYVYQTGGTSVLTHANCENTEIPILTKPEGWSGEIRVSQHLLEHNTEADNVLTFYAYLYEIGKKDGGVEWSALETFTNNQAATP